MRIIERKVYRLGGNFDAVISDVELEWFEDRDGALGVRGNGQTILLSHNQQIELFKLLAARHLAAALDTSNETV